MRSFVALAVSNQWSPDWWRHVTWPEYKTILLMKNEYESHQAAREEADRGDSPIAAARADGRMGKPPTERELAVLPRSA